MSSYVKQLRDPEEYWAGDVLVVGGGLSGMLVAKSLRQLGLDVALLERAGFGADQSNHSHGYLHRGYIYRNASPTLIESFQEACGLWDQLLEGSGIRPVTPASSICFTDSTNARAAETSWRRAGLEVVEAPCPAGLDPKVVRRTYRTGEPSYDFTDIIDFLAPQLDDVVTIQGDARRLKRHEHKSRISGVEVHHGFQRTLLRARYFVLCAGVGNIELLHTATTFLGKALLRTSYMLVLQKTSLPMVSAIFPESEMYGLFLVPRTDDKRGSVWLASNFISYAGAISDGKADGCWVRSIYKDVHRVAPQVEGANFAFYRAKKMELRADPHHISTHALEDYGFDNLVTVAPTKLTLTPLLAQAVRRRVQSTIDGIEVWAGSKEYSRRQSLSTQQERWRDLKLHPFEKLAETGHSSRIKRAATTAKATAATVSGRLLAPGAQPPR